MEIAACFFKSPRVKLAHLFRFTRRTTASSMRSRFKPRRTEHLDPTSLINASGAASARRTFASIGLGYLGLVLLIALGTWALIAQDRERQIGLQRAELASLSRALDEHISRTFSDADTALRSVATAMTLDGAVGDVSAVRFHTAMEEWAERTPQVAVFGAFNPAGEAVHAVRRADTSSTLNPAYPATSVWRADARSFLRLQAPIKDAQDHWYLPLERPARTNSGMLAGVLTGLLSLQYFEDFYRDIRLTPSDSITLLTHDGYLLLNLPDLPQSPERDWSGLLAKSGEDTSTPVFSMNFEQGGVARMGAFRRLHEYPLIVAVTRPVDVALTGFGQMRNRMLLGSGALIVLLGVLAWVTYYDARRREASRLALGRLNETLEERVQRRAAELEQSNRELIAFSYSISHDLRAPLRAINGFAHALREDYGEQLDAQGKDFLERIYRASLRMGELIDELLKLASLSRAPLNVRPVDLNQLASEIIDELRLAHPEREVVFESEAAVLAEGDETLLRNALWNLLNNAWKFTRARLPAIITFTGSDEGEFVRYVLGDNGVGFEMAHAKKLFQPFQQLHANQGYGGTGIGLASVRRIIERHGGNIWAEAEPDHGARFIFTLPVRAKVFRRKRGGGLAED